MVCFKRSHITDKKQERAQVLAFSFQHPSMISENLLVAGWKVAREVGQMAANGAEQAAERKCCLEPKAVPAGSPREPSPLKQRRGIILGHEVLPALG